MPMPPPNPTTDGRSDPQTQHEVKQIVRALKAQGPHPREEVQALVGAQYWDADRFERALAIAVTEGLVRRGADGALSAS